MNESKALTPPRPTSRLVRAKEICRDPKTGTPGILPINRGTWYAWLQQGRVPPGQRLGPKTVAWPLEVVLAVGAPK